METQINVSDVRAQFEARRDYLVKQVSTMDAELKSINRVLNAFDGKSDNGTTQIRWGVELEKAVRTFEHAKEITNKDVKRVLEDRLGELSVRNFSALSTYMSNLANKGKLLTHVSGAGANRIYRVNKL